MDRFEALLHEAREKVRGPLVMPIDEIRLGVAFSELPEPVTVVPRLIAAVFSDENLHLRRIGVQACRRIANPEIRGLRESLRDRLSDDAGWVRYDAAWAIRELGYADTKTLEALHQAANGAVFPDNEDTLKAELGNSDKRAMLEAAYTIFMLKANPESCG